MLRPLLLMLLVLPLAACQLAVPVAAALPLVGSQTVWRGTKQVVEIRSEPDGATVTIPGYEEKTTPAFVMLARGHTHTVRISKDGFKAVTADLISQKTAGGDGGWVGVLDTASGAAFELNPDRLTIKLEPLTQPAAAIAAAPPPPAAQPAATPPIASKAPALPPAAPANEGALVLAEQIARLDRLLSQGLITREEHQILVAAAQGAAAVAGVPTAQ